MEWVSVKSAYPKQEGYYRCWCLSFTKPIKCKFSKARNGPWEWVPVLFLHNGRVPFVVYWERK